MTVETTASKIHCLHRTMELLKAINTSCTSWGLMMNAVKCVCIRFSPKGCNSSYVGISPHKIDQEAIHFVESHSDLGIQIDRTLRFHSHIGRSIRIANGITSNILECTLNIDVDYVRRIFRFHVRPLL